MVDALQVRPAGAETWKPAQMEAPVALSRNHVVDRVEGVSGITRLKLDTAAFLSRPAPELRAGSGIGQAGPRIGEPRPAGANSFASVSVFETPLGEQRI